MNLPDRRVIHRRAEDVDPLVELDEHINEARQVFAKLESTQESLMNMLQEHIKDEAIWKDQVWAAFPDGPLLHRKAHEAMINREKTEADFYRSLKLKIAEQSLWALLKFLALLMVAGLAIKLGVHIDK